MSDRVGKRRLARSCPPWGGHDLSCRVTPSRYEEIRSRKLWNVFEWLALYQSALILA